MSVARAAVDRLGSAFLTADVDAVLAEFVDGDEVVYAGSEAGEVAVGRAALRSLLVEVLGREERYSWRAGAVHEVRAADTVHVVAEAELTVHVPDGDRWRPEELLAYRVSGVLERPPGSDGSWRWRSCTGSEPAPPAAP